MRGLKDLTSADVWRERLQHSRYALYLLFLLSLLETLILPLPIELVLLPWMLYAPRRKWLLAVVALSGNLAGSAAGYALGSLAMEQWGASALARFGWEEAFEEFGRRFDENGFLAVLAAGISPLPFQAAMLAAGAVGYPWYLFMLAAMLARGLRYFGLAVLVALAGGAALRVWRRYSLAASAIVGVLMAGVLAFRFWP